MRRILWLSSLALLVLLLAAGIVYLANPLSARTWILGKALRSSVSNVRGVAALLLAERDPEEAMEVFLNARLDGGGDYEENFWRFVLLPPEAAERLAQVLDDPDPLRAAAAADGLAALAYHNEGRDFTFALPSLIALLGSKNMGLCTAAAQAISIVGRRNRDAVKSLLRASREGCPVLFMVVGMELLDEDVAWLFVSLENGDPHVRASVAGLLGHLSVHREIVLPRLHAALSDPDAFVARAALSSLETLEQRDPVTISAVTALLLRDGVRSEAIEFLARSTAASPGALDAVRAGLREGAYAKQILEELANAFGESISVDLIPDLMHLCRAGADLDLRLGAVEVLGNMGPAARSVAPAIEEILAADDDEDFEWAARIALGNIKRAQ